MCIEQKIRVCRKLRLSENVAIFMCAQVFCALYYPWMRASMSLVWISNSLCLFLRFEESVFNPSLCLSPFRLVLCCCHVACQNFILTGSVILNMRDKLHSNTGLSIGFIRIAGYLIIIPWARMGSESITHEASEATKARGIILICF